MNRSTRLDPLFAALVFLLGGCGGGPEPQPDGDPKAPQAVTRADFAGEWVASDDPLGSMKLTVKGQDDLECVLIDTRGKRFEIEESPEEEDGLWSFETELDVGERGVKILFNRPETSLEVAGDMNYAMGSVMVRFTRQQRDGLEVITAVLYRESRPDDTRRSINLIRVDRPAAPAGQ